MTSEYQAMSDTDAYEHSEHESSRPSAATASTLLRSRSAVAKKADPAPSTSFENEPELLNYADGAQVPDSVYKKIRRNLHLKKTDRERFREEGVRRRQARKYEPSMEFSRVSAHCVCESFELTDILNTLISSKKSHVGKPVLYTDVICFKDYKGRGDVFVFSYGVVVFWGFSEDEEHRFLRDIKPSQTDSLEEPESDDFLFSDGLKSDILSDSITLSTTEILEKLSASFAIAQLRLISRHAQRSVKLSVFEERIENQIESNKHLPERLAKHGKISLDRTEISKKIGQLFIERNSVNLYSDILDTPEFFWEQEQFQTFYHRIYSYLEIGKRVAVLNKRLDIMKELFEMLGAELQDRHSSNLEWIIIWLIVVEVLIEVVWQILIKDVLKLF